MPPFLKKSLLLFLTSLTLLSSFYGYFPPPAQALVCDPYNPEDTTCATTITLACGTAEDPVEFGALLGYDTCVALIVLFSEALLATPAETVETWYSQSIFSFGRKVFDDSNPDEIFGERYTYAQVDWIINSLLIRVCPFCSIDNVIELVDTILAYYKLATAIIDFFVGEQTLEELINSLRSTSDNSILQHDWIAKTYILMAIVPNFVFTEPVASAVGEVKSAAARLNLISPAYAQGLGYDKLGMGSIKDFWKATRNIAYFIAVILLIAAGFMLILRTKISPQASVTIQMIIPRLVTSLFLVTFSYAIVGFIIDMIYVVIVAILGFLNFTMPTIFDGAGGFSEAILIFTGDFSFVAHFLGVYIAIAISLLILSIALPIILASFFPVTAAFAVFIGPLIAPIMAFFMGFFMWSVYVWVRIFGQLILAYITLILYTIAGPIMIIMDILPNSPGMFKKWIMCVIGNASVFVMYAIITMFALLFFNNVTGADTGFAEAGTIEETQINAQFDLPFLPGSGYPRSFLIAFAIYIAFMSMVPNIVASVKELFCKGKDQGDFIVGFVKDTVGQITSAGQNMGAKVNENRTEVDKARTAAKERSKTAADANNPTTANE